MPENSGGHLLVGNGQFGQDTIQHLDTQARPRKRFGHPAMTKPYRLGYRILDKQHGGERALHILQGWHG